MSGPKLTRRLLLETPERVPDGAGGFVESWVPLGTLWAEVTARSGRELGGGAAALSKVSYKITVRAAPYGSTARPKAEQRFREGVRLFRISAVAEDGPLYLTCFATEEVIA